MVPSSDGIRPKVLQVTELVFFRACKMRVERSKSCEERANARGSERSIHH